jgi:hypothetical protein
MNLALERRVWLNQSEGFGQSMQHASKRREIHMVRKSGGKRP